MFDVLLFNHLILSVFLFNSTVYQSIESSLELFNEALQQNYVGEPASPYVVESPTAVTKGSLKNGLYTLLNVLFLKSKGEYAMFISL